ncbi:MAG: hypothetical protein ACKOUR_12920 [Planctomycetota bacterium]
MVRRLASGQLLYEVPRQTVRRWGDRVQVILDRSQHLSPFIEDQTEFVTRLKRLLPHGAVELAVYNEVLEAVRQDDKKGGTRDYQLPEPHVPIIVLGDLGGMRLGGPPQFWRDWADALTERGCHALAVVPCSPLRIAAEIRAAVDVITWQKLGLARSCEEPELRRQIVDQLFQMLAFCRRVEPGLLRAVRRTIERATDASLESDFWQDARLLSRHPRAATLDHEQVSGFEVLPSGERERLLKLVRGFRRGLSPEVWISEIWGLDAESVQLLSAADVADAERWQRMLAAEAKQSTDDALLAW